MGQRNALSWSWNENGADVAEDTERFRLCTGTSNPVWVDVAESRERAADAVWVWVWAWAAVREEEMVMGLDMVGCSERCTTKA